MTAENRLSAPKRRTRAEVQQLVAEFVSSGMRRSEFCQRRGLSFSTLDRHLKKLRWKRRRKPISSANRLGASAGSQRTQLRHLARTPAAGVAVAGDHDGGSGQCLFARALNSPTFEDLAVQRCAADFQAEVPFQNHALPMLVE